MHMVLLVMYYTGSRIGFLTENSELYSMAVSRNGEMWRVGYRKDHCWVHFCLWFI